ncbi:MAG: beta-glucosidase [Actinomycetota bacterium]|jgi:beta-glucosidase|nr:beta-glucosidase [Actinomycetota bacterium]
MWTVAGLPSRGIPSVVVTDGPNGARGSALLGAGRVSALCVPCGSALGATWDPSLVEEVGAALGEEARTKSARVLLAPTVNLVRSPLAGRNFECYSEDPLLTGQIAAGFIRGVQSRSVAATVKHYVGNEAEYERTTISSDIDERALRELYLVPFEHAVRDGGVWAVMTSYNRVNGRWLAEDAVLLDGVLRGDFGFDGVVMTDWFAIADTVAAATAGLDLQMPGPARFYGPPLAEAVRAGEVGEEVVDGIARRWLTFIDRVDAWDDVAGPERAVDREDHRALARRAASDAMVLLRNDGVLPLTGDETIALIGPGATRTQIMGGGSAQLRAHRAASLAEVLPGRWGAAVVVEQGVFADVTVRPLAGPLQANFRDATGAVVAETAERDGRLLWFSEPVEGLDPDAFTFTATKVLRVTDTGPHRFTVTQAGRARLRVGGVVVIDGFASLPPPGAGLFGLGSAEVDAYIELTAGEDVEVSIEYSSEGSVLLHGVVVGHTPPATADLLDRAVAAAAAADVAVVVVGTSDEWETEGHDRTSLHLPGEQDELVRRVCAANTRTVVVVNSGAPVQLDWADDAAAVLQAWFGGQEMADAMTDVLLGVAEPAGRLPVTLPERIEHTPAYGAFPGSNSHVAYVEGLLVGYRWYDTRHLPTRYPFGHGGSYTTFSWGTPTLSVTGDTHVVEVPVTNTGARRGAEVVQAYVEPPPSRLFRPRRELRAFAKVWLEPGETGLVRLELPPRAFAYWDPGSTETAMLAERLGDAVLVPADKGTEPVAKSGWYVQGGLHRVHVSRSIDDVQATVDIDLAGEAVTRL